MFIFEKLVPISLICSLLGYIWLTQLFTFTKSTEIDEHALIAPQFASTFTSKDIIPGNDCMEESLVIPAHKGDGRESLVLLFGGSKTCELFKSMRHFFSREPWLSKDLALVFSPSTDRLIPLYKNLSHYSVLRQAFIIDLSQSSGSYEVFVSFEGSNGALSNQDWLNVALFELRKAGVTSIGMRTGWHGLLFQAVNGATFSVQAFFVDQGVPAVSLAPKLPISRKLTMQLALTIEGAVRAGSNLSQRLHHSFFLYLPISPFVHVDPVFFYPPVILIASPLIAAPLTKAGNAKSIRSLWVVYLILLFSGILAAESVHGNLFAPERPALLGLALAILSWLSASLSDLQVSGDDLIHVSGGFLAPCVLSIVLGHYTLGVVVSCSVVPIYVLLISPLRKATGLIIASLIRVLFGRTEVQIFWRDKVNEWLNHKGVFAPICALLFWFLFSLSIVVCFAKKESVRS